MSVNIALALATGHKLRVEAQKKLSWGHTMAQLQALAWPCAPARWWMKGLAAGATLEDAWNQCDRPDWMWWALRKWANVPGATIFRISNRYQRNYSRDTFPVSISDFDDPKGAVKALRKAFPWKNIRARMFERHGIVV